MSSKPRLIKEYSALPKAIRELIKLAHPSGFDKKLITFPNAKKKLVSALPYETEDAYYLVKMTKEGARKIIKNDKDYDDAGHLKPKVIAKLTKKLEKAAEAKAEVEE